MMVFDSIAELNSYMIEQQHIKNSRRRHGHSKVMVSEDVKNNKTLFKFLGEQ